MVLLLAIMCAGEPLTRRAESDEVDSASQLSNLPNASAPEKASSTTSSSESDHRVRPVNTMLRYGEYCGPGPELVGR